MLLVIVLNTLANWPHVFHLSLTTNPLPTPLLIAHNHGQCHHENCERFLTVGQTDPGAYRQYVGTFLCSVFAEFQYQGVKTFAETTDGSPQSVRYKVRNGSTRVTTSGDVQDVVAEGDLLKLETRTYVIDGLTHNAYGAYNIDLQFAFVAESDVGREVSQREEEAQRYYTIDGTVRKIVDRLPGYACATPGSAYINTTHDLSSQISMGDWIKVGGQSSRVVDTETIVGAGALSGTFAHRIHLDRPHQTGRPQSGCGLAIFAAQRYGTGLPGRVEVEHNSDVVRTTVDHTAMLYRGEVIKLGVRNYVVAADPLASSSSGSNPAYESGKASTVPLETAFVGATQSGLVGYRTRPASGTTATKHMDYAPRVGRITMKPYISRAIIQIPIYDDFVVETDGTPQGTGENIQLRLYDPSYENVRLHSGGMFLDGACAPNMQYDIAVDPGTCRAPVVFGKSKSQCFFWGMSD